MCLVCERLGCLLPHAGHPPSKSQQNAASQSDSPTSINDGVVSVRGAGRPARVPKIPPSVPKWSKNEQGACEFLLGFVSRIYMKGWFPLPLPFPSFSFFQSFLVFCWCEICSVDHPGASRITSKRSWPCWASFTHTYHTWLTFLFTGLYRRLSPRICTASLIPVVDLLGPYG